MSNLFPCPNCGNAISRKAAACPKCQTKFTPTTAALGLQTKRRLPIARVWILLVVAIAGFKLLNVLQPAKRSAPGVQQTMMASSNPALVTRAQYGERWPFTVEAVTLRCQIRAEHPDAPALLAEVNGKAYALTWPTESGGSPQHFQDLYDIWKDDPITGAKVPLQHFIDLAESTCPKSRS